MASLRKSVVRQHFLLFYNTALYLQHIFSTFYRVCTFPLQYTRKVFMLYKTTARRGRLVLSKFLIKKIVEQGHDLRNLLLKNKEVLEGLICNQEMPKPLFHTDSPDTVLVNTDTDSWDILVLAHVIETTLKPENIKVIDMIKNARINYAETAFMSIHNLGSFSFLCEDLVSAIRTLSSSLDKDIQEKCDEQIQNYRTMSAPNLTTVFDDYLGQLKCHGTGIKNLSDIYKETLGKLKKSMNEMEENGLCFKNDQVLDLKIITLGENAEKKRLAEDTLETVWQAALKMAENPKKFEAVRQVVDKILEDIRNISGVKVADIRRKCLLFSLRCYSSYSLVQIIDYLTSELFEENMANLSRELGCINDAVIRIEGNITFESLHKVLENPQNCTKVDDGRLILPVICSSPEGMREVFKLFGNKTTTNRINQIADDLSLQAGETISVKLSPEPKGFSDVFDDTDSETTTSSDSHIDDGEYSDRYSTTHSPSMIESCSKNRPDGDDRIEVDDQEDIMLKDAPSIGEMVLENKEPKSSDKELKQGVLFGRSGEPGYVSDFPVGCSPYGPHSVFTDVPPTPGSSGVKLSGSTENSSHQTSPRHSIIGKSRKRALSHSPISDYLDIQSLTSSSEGSPMLLLGAPHSISRSSSTPSGSNRHLSSGSRQTGHRHSLIGKSRKRAMSHSPISDYFNIKRYTRSSEGLPMPFLGAPYSISRTPSIVSDSNRHLSSEFKLDLGQFNQQHYVTMWPSPILTQDNDANISDVYGPPNMMFEQKDGKKIDESAVAGLAFRKTLEDCNPISVSLERLHNTSNICIWAGCYPISGLAPTTNLETYMFHDGHNIDLSNHGQLQNLQLEGCYQISVSGVTPSTNLKSCKIISCKFSHGQCTSVALFLSQAVSLERLDFITNTCVKAGCDGHIIDLSHHGQLQSLQLKGCDQIYVSGVTTTTNLKSCEIMNCKFSHEQCASVASFLSQAVSLERLHITSNTCMKAGCDGHGIDLSHHRQLQSLQLKGCDQIYVTGVTRTTNLKSCEIINCKFSHEQCTSVASSLSQAVSLERLHITSNRCVKAGCDGHIIDLSHHGQLQSLQLEDCNKIYVSGDTPTTNLKSCEIMNCKFSHEQCTSVALFLSQAVSLERLDFITNTCVKAGCDGHIIDLSHHGQLQSLQLEDCNKIYVSGDTPTTNLKSCEIMNCKFSHEQCTSVALFLSQAVSLERLLINSNRCIKVGCDDHSIDLSHHEQLQSLELKCCNQLSVAGVTPTTNLKACKIDHSLLTHKQYTSLASFLSQAVSSERLYLSETTCKKVGCDGHIIDLSHHEQLESLELDRCNKISVSGVISSTNFKECKITYCTLSHEQYTLFSSFLSQAVSLERLDFITNTCVKAGCDGHIIDLSHHGQLQSLQLKGCDQIYVSGVTTTTNLKSCEIMNCKFSHEQCTSVASFLSQAVSLERLHITSNTCMKAGCDGHGIDLCHHGQLQSLKLGGCYQLSVAGVTLTTNLKACEIHHSMLSHLQCTSLSSFLSQAVSLERLYLSVNTCKEVGCDGHIIDLSRHKLLQSLELVNCNLISISGVSSTTYLNSCEIIDCKFSHEQCTSVSSFLSQAVSLKRLHITSNTCMKAGCDGHGIDLCNHRQLQSLDLEGCYQISVSGVTPTTNLKECEIHHSMLSHKQCISLSSLISQAISLERLHLSVTTCKEVGCYGHNVDLSRHKQLHDVKIDGCYYISRSGVTPTYLELC